MSVAPVETEQPAGDVVGDESLEPDAPWITLVWNDPINLVSYVAYVFETYFGYPKDKAMRLTMAVHEEGRAAVSNGTREEMERDVESMHGFGLWATLQQDR